MTSAPAGVRADVWRRSCRLCGCTNDDCSGCISRTGEPCRWVEEDLCSACLEDTIFEAAARAAATTTARELLDCRCGAVLGHDEHEAVCPASLRSGHAERLMQAWLAGWRTRGRVARGRGGEAPA